MPVIYSWVHTLKTKSLKSIHFKQTWPEREAYCWGYTQNLKYMEKRLCERLWTSLYLKESQIQSKQLALSSSPGSKLGARPEKPQLVTQSYCLWQVISGRHYEKLKSNFLLNQLYPISACLDVPDSQLYFWVVRVSIDFIFSSHFNSFSRQDGTWGCFIW